MLFETTTSVYQWTVGLDGRHNLRKVAIKMGGSSSVPPTATYTGDRVEIIGNEFFLYDRGRLVIKTSAIQV